MICVGALVHSHVRSQPQRREVLLYERCPHLQDELPLLVQHVAHQLLSKLEPFRRDLVCVGSCGCNDGGRGGRCGGAPRFKLLDVVGREPAGLAIECALPPSAILLIICNATIVYDAVFEAFLNFSMIRNITE